MTNADLQAVTKEIEEMDTYEMGEKYLTFWTDEQLFGIPIAHVMQIVEMKEIAEITKIPEFPSYAKGIIELRGSIIKLIDIRLRIGKPEVLYNRNTCIIITDMEGASIGFIVDSVDEIITIKDELIASPPQLPNEASGYIMGIGQVEDRLIPLLDAQKIAGCKN